MGKTHHRLIVGLGLVLTMAWSAGAQDTARLTGTIRNTAGTAVPGVVVTVTANDSSIVRVVATNEKGEYAVNGVMPWQEYVVEASHPQFEKVRVRVKPAAPAQDLSLRLKPKR